MQFPMKKLWRTGVIGNLVAGSLVVLPFVLTVMIIGWLVNTVVGYFGPGTWFGDVLIRGGEALVGRRQEWIAFRTSAAQHAIIRKNPMSVGS